MKKEIVLPKGAEFSVNMSDDQIIITFDELDEIPKYKDGDFLLSESRCFIYRSLSNGQIGAYCGINSMDKIQLDEIDCHGTLQEMRWTGACKGYASDEQREEFLIRLCTERGYIWDAANHKLVKYIKSKR